MPDSSLHSKEEQHPHFHLPHVHIGMRKAKSILAIFIGFCMWQTLRLFLPELEVHPLFIYIYGMIEIRESSDKTKDYGTMRIKATFTAILVGLPFMALLDFLEDGIHEQWMRIAVEITLLLIGALIVLCVAELVKCRVYCGLASAIYIILMVSHIDSSMYLYSVMRAFQTIFGVMIAWVINVKLFPYPPKPGSLSYYWIEREIRKKEKRITRESSVEHPKKWVSIWGDAVSIAENRPERYAKDITLRYPIYMPFSGSGLKLTFDNYCGKEPVTISKVTIFYEGKFHPVLYQGKPNMIIPAGERIVTDPVEITLHKEELFQVSFYLADYTRMRSVVYVSGPLSEGLYAEGDQTENANIDIVTSRKTQLFYFLSNVSMFTEEENRTIVCFGDSITAQDWPDYLTMRCYQEGYHKTAVIRRAASGSRILRQYDCITYESYGLSGENRFDHEVPTEGADTVIIQQGINDIIHPVGELSNVFRPMSDLPTVEELIEGLTDYIIKARSYGYKVYVGTLLPMGGWRTDAPFRQEMRHAYNEFIRTTDLIDGYIDFDKALRDPERPDYFLPEYDSGDHLHPSKKGYERMAAEVPAELLK